MSKYNEYAKKLDAAFKEAAEAQRKARQAFEDAKAKEADATDPLKKQVANAQRKQAQKDLAATQRAAWRTFRDTRDKLSREIKEAVNAAQLANPDDLDMNAVALLNSNVLTPADLAAMKDRYGGNTTMLRMIGGKAKEMRAALPNSETPETRNTRQQLTTIETSCNGAGGVLADWENLVTTSVHFSGESHEGASPELVESLNNHWNDENVQAAITDL